MGGNALQNMTNPLHAPGLPGGGNPLQPPNPFGGGGSGGQLQNAMTNAMGNQNPFQNTLGMKPQQGMAVPPQGGGMQGFGNRMLPSPQQGMQVPPIQQAFGQQQAIPGITNALNSLQPPGMPQPQPQQGGMGGTFGGINPMIRPQVR